MRWLKTLAIFLIILAIGAVAGFSVMRLLGPKIGNTFSTTTSSLPDSEPEIRPPVEMTMGPANPLDKVDNLLRQAMTGSLAYNAPHEMSLDDTVSIELLLNPSLSEEELKKQITAPGTVVTSGDVKITDQMEARIFSPDQNAFTIQALQEPRQLISNEETTKWTWYVTSHKTGIQTLTIVVYRVIEYQGKETSRVVKEYKSDINVKVTPQSQIRPLVVGLLFIAALMVAAIIGRRYMISRRKSNLSPTVSVSSRAARPVRQSTGNIFISYRRSDSADITGRIYDNLVDVFGRETIFKDVDSIPLGVDFKKYLDQQVSECKILLAIIGKDWLDIRDAQGNRRLDDPDDYVRIEIQSALAREIPVIPILVQGAKMPAEESLPFPLQKLAYRNGISIRPDPDFHHDMDRLISALEKQMSQG